MAKRRPEPSPAVDALDAAAAVDSTPAQEPTPEPDTEQEETDEDEQEADEQDEADDADDRTDEAAAADEPPPREPVSLDDVLQPITDPLDHYEPHPIGASFPRRSAPGKKRLEASIREFGLRSPIVIAADSDGVDRILAGITRYDICSRLGIPMRFVRFVGADPYRFAIDENVEHRSDPPGSRALTAVSLCTLAVGQKRGEHDITQEQAAEWLGISVRLVQRAKELLRWTPCPELVQAIHDEVMSLEPAIRIAPAGQDTAVKVLAKMAAADPMEPMKPLAAFAAVRKEEKGAVATVVDPAETAAMSAARVEDMPRTIAHRIERDAERAVGRFVEAYAGYQLTAITQALLDEVERVRRRAQESTAEAAQ